jgi:hypothetical protein
MYLYRYASLCVCARVCYMCVCVCARARVLRVLRVLRVCVCWCARVCYLCVCVPNIPTHTHTICVFVYNYMYIDVCIYTYLLYLYLYTYIFIYGGIKCAWHAPPGNVGARVGGFVSAPAHAQTRRTRMPWLDRTAAVSTPKVP